MIDLLNAGGRFCAESFGLMLVQNTLFLGLIFALLHMLRKASARVRYRIALVGMLKLIVPPFLPLSAAPESGFIELLALGAAPLPQSAGGAAPFGAGAAPLTLAGLLFGAWAVIAAGVLAFTLLDGIRLRRTLHGAESAHDEASQEWSERRGILVLIADRIPVPMTIGLVPRSIHVPRHWSSWSSAARRAVLRHETAHIQRRDGIVRAMESVIRALYWFHPLVPLLARRMDAFREQACDERAASPEPSGRLAYSRQLVEVAEHLISRSPISAPASTLLRQRNELLERIHYLTKEEPNMRLSKLHGIACAAVLALSILALSWYQGMADSNPESADRGQLELSIAPDGQIMIDGSAMEAPEIAKALQISMSRENDVVTIVCDEETPMRELFQIHAVLRAADLTKVRYKDHDAVAMPLVLPSQALIEKTKSIPEEHMARLEVMAGGTCTLDGVKLKPEMIRKVVANRLAENEMLIVSLQMAPEAKFGQYTEALRALKAAGARRIFIEEPGRL